MGFGDKNDRRRASEFLMKYFKEKDITQKYLSDLTGIPYYNIQHYLHGEVFPSYEATLKMGEILGFTVEEFDEYAYEIEPRG